MIVFVEISIFADSARRAYRIDQTEWVHKVRLHNKEEIAISLFRWFGSSALFAFLFLHSLSSFAGPEKHGESHGSETKNSASSRLNFPRIATDHSKEVELPDARGRQERHPPQAAKPKIHTPKLKIEEPIRYPIGVGFSFWAFWMSTETEIFRPDQKIPPIVEMSFGVKWGIFELDFFVAMGLNKMLEPSGTMFGVGAKAGVYSVQLPWFRLFHAFSFGVIADFSFKRNSDVDVSPYPMLGARAHLGYLQFKPFDRVWIEFCPLTLGFPSILEINLGLRYEL